ncbi:MAG: hypothetical protein K8L97_23380 [Anaerolineae bacterium]|nr:hypothetical protein [Anaerolineae bacterium]
MKRDVMQPIRRITFEHESGRIKFSYDGSRFLVFNRDKIASYTIDGKAEGTPFETLGIFDAAYVNDEQVVATIISHEREGCLVTYNIKTQQIISETVVGIRGGGTRSVCVDQQRGRIFAGTFDDESMGGYIGIYNLSLQKLGEFKTPYLHLPFNLAISHSGNKLAVGGAGFGLWDVSSEPKLISEDCPKEDDCTGTPCEVNSLSLTPDGRYAVVGFHGAKGECAVFDGESGKIIGWYGSAWDFMTPHETWLVAISPDGKYVAVGLTGRTDIKIYKVADATISHRYEPQEYGDVVFSPKGDMIAVGGENSVTLWPFEG